MTKVNTEVKSYLDQEREIIDRVDKKDVLALYNKMVAKPPYYFTITYAEGLMMGVLDKIMSGQERIENMTEISTARLRWAKYFLRFGVKRQEMKSHSLFQEVFETICDDTTDNVDNEIRLVDVDKELQPLLENTRNEIFFRPLFFKRIFVNTDIVVDNLIVRGFLAFEHEEMGKRDIVILCVCIDTIEHSDFWQTFALTDDREYTAHYECDDEIKVLKKAKQKIKNILVNIIDMVDNNAIDEDIEMITIKIGDERNRTRIKKGKIPLPTRVVLKPTPKFSKFLIGYNDYETNTDRTHYTHKFYVRGHYRYYKDLKSVDKEKHQDTATTKGADPKRGKYRIRINPYEKGKGILLNKDYIIK